MLHNLIIPNKLNPGDTVTTISLSWGGAASFPYRYEIGVERLKSIFGLNVLHTKHALKSPDWLRKNPSARADDLMEAFADPKIKGIFSIIGGDDSIRLLPYINYQTISNNPKIVLGFSDTTITHFICLKAGLRSYYGTSVMTGFAENNSMHSYTIEGLKRTIFTNDFIGNIPQNTLGWTNQLLNWENSNNQQITRKLNEYVKWNFISNTNIKSVQGHLIGGCVDTFTFMLGTEIWPELDFWDNAILFLETSEEGISPNQLMRILRNLVAQGILHKVNALLFSKPGGHKITCNDFEEYDKAILQILNESDIGNLPIVTNLDFGHTDPIWTLPYGALVEIDFINKEISIKDSGVR